MHFNMSAVKSRPFCLFLYWQVLCKTTQNVLHNQMLFSRPHRRSDFINGIHTGHGHVQRYEHNFQSFVSNFPWVSCWLQWDRVLYVHSRTHSGKSVHGFRSRWTHHIIRSNCMQCIVWYIQNWRNKAECRFGMLTVSNQTEKLLMWYKKNNGFI